ncbi:MAG: sigma factor-like helix-turn-helix DNA-binding protein [Solirubrobacteraceae bacterium]
MSLDALAPDQRAVVQLVLQQDRSYENLAALLGITPEAVRERAHRGMERLAPGEAVDPADRAQISDYLLGQQSVTGREATRSLLTSSQPARSWALAIAAELAGVARSALPEVPAGPAAAAAPPAREPEPTEPVIAHDTDPILEDPIAPARARPRPRQRPQATTAPARARPRPRQRPQATTPPADFGFGEVTGSSKEPASEIASDGETARTSRLGGALLISGLAVFVAALVIWLVARDSDDPGSETATTGTTTGEATATAAPTDPTGEATATAAPTDPTGEATATAAPTDPTGASDFVSAGILALDPQDGGDAAGQVELFVSQSQEALAFNVIAENLEPTTKNFAYAIWLTGGKADHFLGFADVVEQSGVLQASGPMEDDAAKLLGWLRTAKSFVISRENADPGASPADVLLQGAIADIAAPSAGGAATPTP